MVRIFPFRWRRFSRDQRGSAAVEFAVSAGVLFTTLIGAMNMSQGVYTYHYVSEAAREGTRYAMVNGSSVTSPVTSSDVQTYVRNLGYPGIKPSLMTVTTAWSAYPTGTTCSSPCNDPGDLVTVTTSYAYPLSIPFVGKRTLTMTSASAMVISQ